MYEICDACTSRIRCDLRAWCDACDAYNALGIQSREPSHYCRQSALYFEEDLSSTLSARIRCLGLMVRAVVT